MRATTSIRGHALRAASRFLRAAADRLEPPRRVLLRPRGAPLVRIGGRWWLRDELAPIPVEEDAAGTDVQLLP